jgi:hypothetical protein
MGQDCQELKAVDREKTTLIPLTIAFGAYVMFDLCLVLPP